MLSHISSVISVISSLNASLLAAPDPDPKICVKRALWEFASASLSRSIFWTALLMGELTCPICESLKSAIRSSSLCVIEFYCLAHSQKVTIFIHDQSVTRIVDRKTGIDGQIALGHL